MGISRPSLPTMCVAALTLALTAPIAGDSGTAARIQDCADRPVKHQSASAHSAAANPRQAQADFNQDGNADLAVLAAGKRGYVTVRYGGAHGVESAQRQLIRGASVKLEEGTEAELVGRDLDGDGYTDLAVEDRDGLSVLWGGKKGLGHPVPLKRGGNAMQTVGGDFNGDDHADLVVLSSDGKLRLVRGPFTRDGAATGGTSKVNEGPSDSEWRLVAGDMTGDGRDDLIIFSWYEEVPEASVFQAGTRHGLGKRQEVPAGGAGTVGDVDGDGYGDLVMVSFRDGYADGPSSRLRVVYGSPHGPDGGRESPVVDGVGAEQREADLLESIASEADNPTLSSENSTLSSGNVDGDGFADVAVGIPDQSGDSGKDETLVIRGSCVGLTGTGARAYAPGDPGMPRTSASWNEFGASVKLTDVDGDGRDDLAVGAPGEVSSSNADGALWTLPGGPRGPVVDGASVHGPGTLDTPARQGLGGNFAR